MDEIEAIERATLEAVPPERTEQWGGWLLAYDPGTVGRAHSATPLRHASPAAGTLAALERCYGRAGRAPVLRVPERAAFDRLRAELEAGGYQRSKPTLVQVAGVDALERGACAADIRVEATPGPEWEQVFLGEGFDAVDGASRLAILRRARASVFASVRVDGRTVAVGSACFSHGWCGVHGMRTLPAQRGRGLAGAVLATLARLARERGIGRAFLQVDAGNAAARALYAGRGFVTAWEYAYWRKPG